MVWFRVDDSLADHPKVLALQERRGWEGALALWTLAGAWSGKQLTDGFVPRAIVARLGCNTKSAELLVSVGLWESVENGYQFHDWKARNPLKTQVESEREKTRNRVEAHRQKQSSKVVGNAVTESVSNTPCTPVPSRPDHTRPEEESESARTLEREDDRDKNMNLLARGYAKRYEAQPGNGMWQALGANYTHFSQLAVWAEKQAERDGLTVGQISAAMWDEFFADERMAKLGWPIRILVQDGPDTWLRRSDAIKALRASKEAAE